MASVTKIKREPPGPTSYPVLGHLPYFLKDKLGYLSRCAAEYGDVVKLKLGGTTYLLNNPEDIRHVLVTNSNNYEKSPRLTSIRGKRLSGHGLLTSRGDHHLRQRKTLRPIFQHKSVKGFVKVMIDCTEALKARWKNGLAVNVAEEMMMLAQEIIIKSLFGMDFKDVEGQFAQALTIRRRYIQYIFSSLLPWPELMPVRISREYRKAMQIIDRTIYREIQKRRIQKLHSVDFISMLIDAKYEDGSGMEDHLIRDEALTLAITGHETIGEALAWTWYCLSQNPDVEYELMKELDANWDEHHILAGDIPRLPYTAMVISESMRLYPPTWIFIRMAREDDVLPTGVHVASGTKIYLCQYVTHRNARFYPEPEGFNPKRFEQSEIRNRPQYAYFPFGGGPRLCIGEAYAKLECATVVASIARKYSMELLPHQVVTPEPGITLRPKNGIMMCLRLH